MRIPDELESRSSVLLNRFHQVATKSPSNRQARLAVAALCDTVIWFLWYAGYLTHLFVADLSSDSN